MKLKTGWRIQSSKSTSYALLLMFFCMGVFSSCNQTPEVKKVWHDRSIMPAHLKWFLNAANYTDSNYTERFNKYYYKYISGKHFDSALYCLIVYGEMADQNYIYDSLYLYTALNHVKTYEPVSHENGELIKLYYYIGSQYEAIGKNTQAIDWYKRGMNHPHILPRTKIKCKGMLANVYGNIGEDDKVMPLRLEMLDYYVETKDTINIGVTYASMALHYADLNAYNLARNYIEKALVYSRLKNDTNTLIQYLDYYWTIEKNGFNDTLAIFKTTPEVNRICDVYSKLTPYNEWMRLEMNFHMYFYQNKYDSVKIFLDKLVALQKDINSPSYETKVLFLTGLYESETGKLPVNEKQLIKVAEEARNKQSLWEADLMYQVLYHSALQKGNYQQAFEWYKQLTAIEKDRYQLNNKGQLLELEIKYQSEKKDQEILVEKKKNQVSVRNIVLLGAALLIAVLTLFINIIWQRHKRLELKRKNELMFTQKLMENTEEERRRIAKDLHDSVGHELLSVKNAITNKMQFTEEKIDHILAEVREISRSLFPVMFEEVGLKISVEQLAENIQLTDNFYVGYDINYIAGTLDVKSELHIYRIIQEALNNTRKYAQAQSARIDIEQSKDFVILEIKDNGKGFDVMQVLKSGKSFGLLAINQRSKALHSNADIVSNAQGTSITLKIPLRDV